MNESGLQADAAVLARVLALFAAVSAFTIFWLGLNLALPWLQATGIALVVFRIIIHVVLLAGLWLALKRTGFDGSVRLKVWLAIVVPFTAWLAVIWLLAIQGAFRPAPGALSPALPLAILGPVLLALPILLRSARVAAVLDAMPASWLVGLQMYRVVGGIFLVAWSRGEMPGVFALPAGAGDVLVGLLALPVAYLLHVRAPGARKAAIAWNLLGLADFTIAVGIGTLSAPGPLQVIVPETPNAQLLTFPTVMIPAFAVPSSILLHALSLRQLARQRR